MTARLTEHASERGRMIHHLQRRLRRWRRRSAAQHRLLSAYGRINFTEEDAARFQDQARFLRMAQQVRAYVGNGDPEWDRRVEDDRRWWEAMATRVEATRALRSR